MYYFYYIYLGNSQGTISDKIFHYFAQISLVQVLGDED